MDFKILSFILLSTLSTTALAWKKKDVYQVGLFKDKSGTPAVFPMKFGRTIVYYYYYGTANRNTIKTTFEGKTARHFLNIQDNSSLNYAMQVRCRILRRLPNKFRILDGYGVACSFYGRRGVFTFTSGSPPFKRGVNFMQIKITNGKGQLVKE